MARPGDTDDAGADTVSVSIRLSSQPERRLDQIRVGRLSTVADLKQVVAQTVQGKPKPEGIVCVLGGRVLRDGEVIGDLAGPGRDSARDDDDDDGDLNTRTLDLTLIVRPSAWTETPPSPSPATVTAPTLAPPVPSTHAIESDASEQPVELVDHDPEVLSAESQPPEASTLQTGSPKAATSPPSGYTPAYVVAGTSASPTSAPEPAAAEPAPTVAPVGNIPAPSREETAATTPLPSAANPYATYLAYLHRLVPIQRALLLLNLQKAHVWYAARSDATTAVPGTTSRERLAEVEAMLKEVGVWSLVEQNEVEAKKQWDDSTRRRDEERRGALLEFQVVRVAGLPYLLHTPPALLARQADGEPDQELAFEAHVALHRNRAIYRVLTTMLQLVLTLQPTAPAIAYGRGSGSIGRTGGGGGGLTGMRAAALDDRRGGALGLAAAAPIPAVPARRRATLSVIINLDAVLSLFVPLFLLSLKLAFLLWIFGRRASTSKRIALAIAAAIWVAYEGWAIQRRRAQATRERERAERERRRAARAAAQAQRNDPVRRIVGDGGGGGDATGGAAAPLPDRAQPAQQQPPPAQAQQGPGQAAPPTPGRRRTPRNHQHRVPASLLSPKYWLNLIAAVGLVSEARELGLSPRYIAGRPISPAPPPPRTAAERRREAIKRGLRNVAVAVVLFVGTLSPEVERKRKKAIEKRERLLAEKRVAAARQEALRIAAARAVAPALPATASPTEAPVASTSALDDAPPPRGGELRQRRTTITPSDSPFLSSHGRISDAELFRDGPSEAYTTRAGSEPADNAALPNASASSGGVATSSGEGFDPAQTPPTPIAPSEDDDFAATSSASASSSAGDSLGEEDDDDEGGIARRVRARRARLLAQGGEGPAEAGGPGQARDGQDAAVDQVVALF